jgi:hypothetical protein
MNSFDGIKGGKLNPYRKAKGLHWPSGHAISAAAGLPWLAPYQAPDETIDLAAGLTTQVGNHTFRRRASPLF